MEIGVIGLGRMGANMARRMARGGARGGRYDRDAAARDALAGESRRRMRREPGRARRAARRRARASW